MCLGSIIRENSGRDIYICLEIPDGGREERIIKKYSVTEAGSCEGYAVLLAEGGRAPSVKVRMDADVSAVKDKLLMTVVEARHRENRYHIYIADHIQERPDGRLRSRFGA